MAYIDFISELHSRTIRDYVGRVTAYPKAKAAVVAKKFGQEYWDGDRRYGYGGYHYDGRWRVVAEKMVEHYGMTDAHSVLDVGCGKAHLLYEFTQIVPGIRVVGLDISEYAIAHAKDEIRPQLQKGSAGALPFDTDSFDLVISLGTLHNLYCYELTEALSEIERVGKKDKYIMMESYRNEEEKANLLYWQLTCEGFYTPEEWSWWFDSCDYSGDYSFIYFE